MVWGGCLGGMGRQSGGVEGCLDVMVRNAAWSVGGGCLVIVWEDA